MKILLHSNAPWAHTGYGQQTAQLATRLRDAGHEVALSTFYGLEGAEMEWGGMRVFPTDHTKFGKAMLPYYVGEIAGRDTDPREVLVLTLMDVWALTAQSLSRLRLASWTPVDHEPMPPRLGEYFASTGARPIAMSRFGETQLKEAGFDPLYAPHAVDTNVMRPLGGRDELRRALKVPEDAFVVGMVANNKGTGPPRKAFPQVMQAFSIFHRDHPDSVLYLHSEVFGLDAGVNLLALARICGIPDTALATTDQLRMHLGIPGEAMAAVYNVFDVLANPSYGEGFGIPIIEAQACGVPVIVNDCTSMPELLGAGWLVDGDDFYDPPHGAWYKCPSVAEIYQAIEQAYETRGDQQLREQAREFALAYDADCVFAEYWTPVLDQLELPREIGPLVIAEQNGLNREQRRAAAKQRQKQKV